MFPREKQLHYLPDWPPCEECRSLLLEEWHDYLRGNVQQPVHSHAPPQSREWVKVSLGADERYHEEMRH